MKNKKQTHFPGCQITGDLKIFAGDELPVALFLVSAVDFSWHCISPCTDITGDPYLFLLIKSKFGEVFMLMKKSLTRDIILLRTEIITEEAGIFMFRPGAINPANDMRMAGAELSFTGPPL